MTALLLALWIALIGADRIDLAGGNAPFVLTPFLALTPFVVVSQLWRRRREGNPVPLTRRALVYMATAAGLVTVVLASVFVARDMQISASRALLLTANLAATFAVVVLIAGQPDSARVLARGAAASLLLFVVFDVAQVLWWIGQSSETMRVGPMLIRFGDLQNVGTVPRLAGPVGDANRGGFVLLLYAVLIARGEPRRVLRGVALFLAVVLLIATLSRSAALGAIATLAVSVLVRRTLLSPRALVAIGAVTAVLLFFFFVTPGAFTRVADVVTSPVVDRLSAGEGSAQSHFALIERGWDQATHSIPNATVGVGYGNAHLYLQDVFPGNKYGNYHSLYISMFAEAGVVALLLTLVLLLTPLAFGGPWRPLVAGAAFFNVFYQTPAEPAFWFLLASAWLAMPHALSAFRKSESRGR